MAHNLIQILPFRSLQSDGVGDYAAIIARQLRGDHRIDSHFIVARPDEGTPRVDDGFATSALLKPDRESLLAELAERPSPTALMIHVSGYGYARYGAPFWLRDALADWRINNPGIPVIAIFHELFVTGPLWDRRFWYGLRQQRFVREMAKLADHCITPAADYGDWLVRHSAPPRPPIVMPVVSTVGEMDGRRHVRPRGNRLAVFARGQSAGTIYRQWYRSIEQLVRCYGIEQIVDIGHRPTAPPTDIGGAAIMAHGRIPADTLSDLLMTCRFGFLEYGTMPLGKSTILAAYAAHGVVPLCAVNSAESQDGLVAGREFVHVSPQPGIKAMGADQESDMRECISRWYQLHDLNNQAMRLAGLILAPSAKLEQQC